MIKRIKEAARKGGKYWGRVLTSRSPRMAYVGGWLGHNNLGDEALFEAYKKLFSDFSIIHYPKVGGRVLSIPNKYLHLVNCAVLGGGTLINRSSSLWTVKEALTTIDKFIVFGTGVGNPEFWTQVDSWKSSLDEWKPLLERASYIGVRGPMSAELLIDCGLENVEVIGDPVLFMAESCLKKENSGNVLGLNLGVSNGNVWGSEKSIMRDYIELASLAKKAGWRVKWFVVWPEDLKITRFAAKESGTMGEVYEVYTDHQEYLDLVRPMTAFVGMKLHAVVLATCAYVPSIMTEYRPKCRDFMKSIDSEQFNVRTDEFNAPKIWESVQDIARNRHTLIKQLFDKIQVIKNNQGTKAQSLSSAILKR